MFTIKKYVKIYYMNTKDPCYFLNYRIAAVIFIKVVLMYIKVNMRYSIKTTCDST